MKVLVGLGILLVTVGLILFFTNLMPVASSGFLQIAVAGVIILSMSYLSIRIFSGLEYV
jgi:hypothetical protein